MLASVDSLSDEETCNVKVPSAVPRIPRPRPPGFKRRLGRFSQKDSADLKKLRWIVSSKCGCSGKCYQPFNETPHLFNEWAKLRRTFQNMTKLEKDEHATQLRFKVFLISNMLFSDQGLIMLSVHAISLPSSWLLRFFAISKTRTTAMSAEVRGI